VGQTIEFPKRIIDFDGKPKESGRVFKCIYRDGTYQYSVLNNNNKIFIVDEEEIIKKQ
jgi:hypothetical protein